ncbi:MAG TPA: sigma 54-interacting transcriptional regulator, partial [Anaerovoracaceae bacterium]|nr:sigma 54-interacting transcriptional regulator [Anaerovoracaceae bacterium]
VRIMAFDTDDIFNEESPFGDSGQFILQYVFLLDKDGKILTCDESGREFLKKIDLGIFYAQLHSIKLNSAITNTTVILENKSYNLRMVPTDLQQRSTLTPGASDSEFIIVLQDQTLFSVVFQSLNKVKLAYFKSIEDINLTFSELDKIFGQSLSGIFVTNSNRTVIYANDAYINATGLVLDKIIGRDISELGKSGFFQPLITPSILETHESLTTLQKLSTGKFAIISGSPVYDSGGGPILIITCVNVITTILKADFPDQFYDPGNLKLNINKRGKEHSIDIIAESQVMKTILQEAIKIARYNVTVLLLGDSGVGKEVIASIIHSSSIRNNEKFVKINCSTISPSLLESELFGYEAGAFTGALSKGKAGLFEVADKGTLLLDEIGDLPIDLQAKLLRVIQSHEFYRVGGLEPVSSNVRILAATNRDLEKMIAQGKFREDLFYRLNVISIDIPPLRDRKEDIKPLLLHFIYIFNRKYGTNKQFSEALIDVLQKYHWPGNIRELQNVVERLIVLCIEDYLLPEHLYSKYKMSAAVQFPDNAIQVNRLIPLKEAIDIVESILVTQAMAACKSTRKAAELLGVSQSTVMRKLKENNRDVPD